VRVPPPPPIDEMVNVFVPGLPTTVAVVPSPTIVILPARGPTAPPLLPVRVCTIVVPPLPTVPN